MRRVLFVGVVADPSQSSGYRTRMLCGMEAVREAGVEPFLLTLCPSKTGLRSQPRRALRAELHRRGLAGCVVPHPPAFRTRAGKKVMLQLSGAIVAAFARVYGAEVIHSHGPYATAASLAARRMVRKPVVFDAHGALPPELELNARATCMPPRRIQWELELASEIECRAWHRSDAVVVVSRALLDHFSTVYGCRRTTAIAQVPCAVSRSALCVDNSARTRTRSALHIEQREVLVYVGSLAPYQMAPAMLRLFSEVYRHRPAAFLLIISQTPSSQWHVLARAQGLVDSRSYCVIEVPQHRVPEVTTAGDIGIMLREQTLLNQVAFPTKLGEYLAAGVPVLATSAAHDPAELIAQHAVGRVVADAAASSWTQVTEFLGEVCKTRQEWSARCRLIAERHLAWSAYGPTIVDLYHQVSGAAC
jgi:glycosyltransferase involved in cell wall biosynthesis